MRGPFGAPALLDMRGFKLGDRGVADGWVTPCWRRTNGGDASLGPGGCDDCSERRPRCPAARGPRPSNRCPSRNLRRISKRLARKPTRRSHKSRHRFGETQRRILAGAGTSRRWRDRCRWHRAGARGHRRLRPGEEPDQRPVFAPACPDWTKQTPDHAQPPPIRRIATCPSAAERRGTTLRSEVTGRSRLDNAAQTAGTEGAGAAVASTGRRRRLAWTTCKTWSSTTAIRMTEPTMMKVQLASRRHRRGTPSASW
jgi:hypothetical protein